MNVAKSYTVQLSSSKVHHNHCKTVAAYDGDISSNLRWLFWLMYSFIIHLALITGMLFGIYFGKDIFNFKHKQMFAMKMMKTYYRVFNLSVCKMKTFPKLETFGNNAMKLTTFLV